MSAAASKSDRARLFFALWPDETVRAALAAIAREAQAECGGRAITPRNVHLTLFFVGSFELAGIPALEKAAGSLRTTGFELVLDRLGYWPHNRIVWLGSTHNPPPLAALATDLRSALGREGIQGEERPYVPHVTLVRNAGVKPAPRRIAPCRWEIRELVLAQSVPSTDGVRYEVMRQWPL